MGGRLSRRGGRRAELREEKTSGDTVSDDTSDGPAYFIPNALKYFRKCTSVQSAPRLEIRGNADKYPYWLSIHTLVRPNGDEQRKMEFFELNSEKGTCSVTPQLPTFLVHYINKTFKLTLKFKCTTITDNKRAAFPEHDIIQKRVTRLLVRITADSIAQPKHVTADIYEQHRTGSKRRRLLLRFMPANKVLCNQHHDIALLGEDFMLCLKRTMGSPSDDALEGIYVRSLDTLPVANITFECVSSGTVSNTHIPVSITQPQEYAAVLLTKFGKGFRIKFPKHNEKQKTAATG